MQVWHLSNTVILFLEDAQGTAEPSTGVRGGRWGAEGEDQPAGETGREPQAEGSVGREEREPSDLREERPVVAGALGPQSFAHMQEGRLSRRAGGLTGAPGSRSEVNKPHSRPPNMPFSSATK